MSVVIVPLSSQAPALARRFGVKQIGVIGLLSIVVGFGWMSTLDASATYLEFLPGLFAFGAGLALAAAPASESIVNALPPSKQGVASAVNDTSREFGGALGIATVGSAFTAGYEGGIDDAALAVEPAINEALRSSPLVGSEIAASIPDPTVSQLVVEATNDAFMVGFGDAVLVAATAALIGAAIVAWRAPREVAQPADDVRPTAATDRAVPSVAPGG